MFVSRAHHDEIVRDLRESYGHACGMVDAKNAELIRADERYNDLLEKYHALRVSGANVPEKAPDAPKSPLVAIGPKTIAALREMSVGLPNTVRRSMEASALALHAQGLADAEVAAAVRQGETPSANGNGKR